MKTHNNLINSDWQLRCAPLQPLMRSVEDAEKIFLKTIIPSRKTTEIYLRGKNENQINRI